MDSLEFRMFLDLLMCSDPWPMRNEESGEYGEEAMKSYANRLAHDWGFEDWIDAYHKHAA